jgi:hypothetical protein
MALGLSFSPDFLSSEHYGACIKRLDDAGQGAPGGRLYQSALSSGEGLHAFDVWESQEAFEAFGQTVLPTLSELGVVPGLPHPAAGALGASQLFPEASHRNG